MRVLVTGAEGFIGRNLRLALATQPAVTVISYDLQTEAAALDAALDECDVVFHLAGVNRPQREDEFEPGNVGSLETVTQGLERRGRRPLIVLASSIQALLDNAYGRSKRLAEERLREFSQRSATPARVFRLPGVFGKWCRPNYNSVVATFCHNVARDLPISVSDPDRQIELVHVDDIVRAWTGLLARTGDLRGFERESVAPQFTVPLGRLADLIRGFRESRRTLRVPDLADPLVRRLHATYASYLPGDGLGYDLDRRRDARGVLAELLKADGLGQIFVSRTLPGITRGNHYHHAKVEKFVVLEGEALIRFRHVLSSERADYRVCGTDLRVVDIPPGWTHSIENVGAGEMVVLFWSSEVFDPNRPDTCAEEVLNGEA